LIEAAGVSMECIETQPNREIVYARLPGNGAKRPLMLCNHLDVVPVEAEYWDVPPFEGVIEDGFIYGRGAVDMKGGGVMQLIAFLLIARQRTPLARDVVFCGVPDEEAGGTWGLMRLCDNRPDLVDVEYELNEGGMGLGEFFGKPARIMPIATTEKKVCGLLPSALRGVHRGPAKSERSSPKPALRENPLHDDRWRSRDIRDSRACRAA
jgi:acetylornithine deacetylase/succinyl-diaminopimelate desuccinylase-like protein